MKLPIQNYAEKHFVAATKNLGFVAIFIAKKTMQSQALYVIVRSRIRFFSATLTTLSLSLSFCFIKFYHVCVDYTFLGLITLARLVKTKNLRDP